MILLIKCIWYKNQKCAQKPKSNNFQLKELTPNKTISNSEVKINIIKTQQDSYSSKTTEVSIPEVSKVQVPAKPGKLLQELTPNKKIKNAEVKINITANQQDSISSKATELSLPEVQVPAKSGKLLQELLNSNKKTKNAKVKINITTNKQDCTEVSIPEDPEIPVPEVQVPDNTFLHNQVTEDSNLPYLETDL